MFYPYTKLQAYLNILDIFNKKGYTQGEKISLKIYHYNPKKERKTLIFGQYQEYLEQLEMEKNKNLTPGHFVGALDYCHIKFSDIPEKFKTREFYIHALSGIKKDIIEHIKSCFGKENNIFDKQFFKDYIITNNFSLNFSNSIFSYIPDEYIDEELVMCALIKSVESSQYFRMDFLEWFFELNSRKPEILTKEMFYLSASIYRISSLDSVNKFLNITPDEFKDEDFYFNLCINKSLESILKIVPACYRNPEFYIKVLESGLYNIVAFDEIALETIVPDELLEAFDISEEKIKRFKEIEKFKNLNNFEILKNLNLTFWKASILFDGDSIEFIPLNNERILFFKSIYDKDSPEYTYYFKEKYKKYLEENTITIPYISKSDLKKFTNIYRLPILFKGLVPEEFRKIYDSEEYLLEIYRSLNINILGKCDEYYYYANLPENLTIKGEISEFSLLDGEKEIIDYFDYGNWWDREVKVSEIHITLNKVD